MLNIFVSASLSLSCFGLWMWRGHHSWSLVTSQHNSGFQSNLFFFFPQQGISNVQVYVCSAWANMEIAQRTRVVRFFFFWSVFWRMSWRNFSTRMLLTVGCTVSQKTRVHGSTDGDVHRPRGHLLWCFTRKREVWSIWPWSFLWSGRHECHHPPCTPGAFFIKRRNLFLMLPGSTNSKIFRE